MSGRHIANASSGWWSAKGKMTVAAAGHRGIEVWFVRDGVRIVLDRIGLFVLGVG